MYANNTAYPQQGAGQQQPTNAVQQRAMLEAQHRQQQAMFKQRQAMMQGQMGPGAGGGPVAGAQNGGMVPQGMDPNLQSDGNDALRGAKRRKPTDRSLPSFLPSPSPRFDESSDTLQKLSTGYKTLQAVERKMDWTLARKKLELAEQVQGTRMAGVVKTLRVHLETTTYDQPWMKTDEELANLKVGPDPVFPQPPTASPAPAEPAVIPLQTPEATVPAASEASAASEPTPAVGGEVKMEPATVDVGGAAPMDGIVSGGSGAKAGAVPSTVDVSAATEAAAQAPVEGGVSVAAPAEPATAATAVAPVVAGGDAVAGAGMAAVSAAASSTDAAASTDAVTATAAAPSVSVGPSTAPTVPTPVPAFTTPSIPPPSVGAPALAESTPAPAPPPLLPTQEDLLAAPPTIPVSYATGEGVPRFSLVVKSELLGDADPKNSILSTFIKRVVVETDRDATLYDKTGPIEWRRTSPVAALSLSFPSSVATKLKVAVHLEHRPEQFTLIPDFAALTGTQSSDRVGALQALWMYVRSRGLLDEEKKLVRTDEILKKLFGGQETVPFHHLPEYVNRFLVPLKPVEIEYIVPVDVATAHSAFDLELTVEDPARGAIERVAAMLNSPQDKAARELGSLDEKIAADATIVKSSQIKRSFLAAFTSRPIETLESYVASQATDLDTVLSGPGAGTGVGSDEMRRGEAWTGDWVEDGAGVWSSRKVEARIREAVPGQQQQQLQPQLQQAGVPGRR